MFSSEMRKLERAVMGSDCAVCCLGQVKFARFVKGDGVELRVGDQMASGVMMAARNHPGLSWGGARPPQAQKHSWEHSRMLECAPGRAIVGRVNIRGRSSRGLGGGRIGSSPERDAAPGFALPAPRAAVSPATGRGCRAGLSFPQLILAAEFLGVGCDG